MKSETEKNYERILKKRAQNVANNLKHNRSMENIIPKGTNFKSDPKRVSALKTVADQIQASGGTRQNLTDTKKVFGSSPVNDVGIDPRVKNKKLLSNLDETEFEKAIKNANDEIPGNKFAGGKMRFGKLLSKLGTAGDAFSMGKKAIDGDMAGLKKEGGELIADKALDLATGTNPVLMGLRALFSSPSVEAADIDPNNPEQMKQLEEIKNKVWGGQQPEAERAKLSDLNAEFDPALKAMKEANTNQPKDTSSKINNSRRFKKLFPEQQ